MSHAQRTGMTLDEFLDWEAEQDRKWEYADVPVAMTGGTFNHARIAANILLALGSRLVDGPCQPVGADMKVRTARGTIRYPDALVVCVPMRPRAVVVDEPRIVFEVLSDGTAATDKTEKLVEYLATPSIERYVMLEQDQQLATVIARTSVGWSLQIVEASGTLAMPEIGIEVPMAELYRGIGFSEPEFIH